MNEFIEHIGADLRELGNKAKAALAKLTGKPAPEGGSALVNTPAKTNYEINLVPEVKAQMIKAQKMRNLVLFICIVVSSAAIGAVVVLFGIKSGQDLAISNQDKRIELMSEKINNYAELNSLITIQGQLEAMSDIVSQKTVITRVFGALGVMLQQGADSVQLSQLNINLETNVLRMEGQADAKTDPLIDYRVLESFKKGVALTKYDYGRYVDADGNQLPTYCVKEADEEGNAYKTGDSYYAWWDITIEGCEASQRGGETVEGAKFYYSSDAEVEKGIPSLDLTLKEVCDENDENCVEKLCKEDDSTCVNPEEIVGTPIKPEQGEGDAENDDENSEDNQDSENSDEPDQPSGGAPQENKYEIKPMRVKVWRTPQFSDWYQAKRMNLDGSISGIEHFDSECFKYSGSDNNGTVRWNSTNDCMLAPDGLEEVASSNARDESDNLVLKFTGIVNIAEEFFSFSNKHMIAIGPRGQNVTDSYLQIGNMFVPEATDCEEGDTECLNNSSNRGGR